MGGHRFDVYFYVRKKGEDHPVYSKHFNNIRDAIWSTNLSIPEEYVNDQYYGHFTCETEDKEDQMTLYVDQEYSITTSYQYSKNIFKRFKRSFVTSERDQLVRVDVDEEGCKHILKAPSDTKYCKYIPHGVIEPIKVYFRNAASLNIPITKSHYRVATQLVRRQFVYGWRYDENKRQINIMLFNQTNPIREIHPQLKISVKSNVSLEHFKCVSNASFTIDPGLIKDVHKCLYISPYIHSVSNVSVITLEVCCNSANVKVQINYMKYIFDGEYVNVVEHETNWKLFDVKTDSKSVALQQKKKTMIPFFGEEDTICVKFEEDPGEVTVATDFTLVKSTNASYFIKAKPDSFSYLNQPENVIICTHSNPVCRVSVLVNEIKLC